MLDRARGVRNVQKRAPSTGGKDVDLFAAGAFLRHFTDQQVESHAGGQPTNGAEAQHRTSRWGRGREHQLLAFDLGARVVRQGMQRRVLRGKLPGRGHPVVAAGADEDEACSLCGARRGEHDLSAADIDRPGLFAICRARLLADHSSEMHDSINPGQ